MENIISYINQFGAMIASLVDNLNFGDGADIFYVVVTIGLNFVYGIGIVFMFSIPFVCIYWILKFVCGAYE